MNYRHAFHAGNFADVIKHVVLTGVLLHLKRKEKPFRVIDTHGGRGLHDITGKEAQRTGEALEGIARLQQLGAAEGLPEALATYLKIVRAWEPDRYPGSPLIAASLLRLTDRLIAIERHPDEEQHLRATLATFPNAKCFLADGYSRLPALLPPPERRGLVLIDPPYEADDEFARVAKVLGEARKRFATGIYLVWYPVKSAAKADALAGEVLTGGTEGVLRISIAVGHGADKVGERLSAAGLIVVNPPYGLAEEMGGCAKILSPLLGRGGAAEIAVEVA